MSSAGFRRRSGRRPRAGLRRGSINKYPDPTVARANKRLASRFYQLKTGHCLTGQYLAWATRRPDASCWWCQYEIRLVSICLRTARHGKANKRPSGRPSWKRLESPLAQPGARTAPRSRSCSPTSGAARRFSISSLQDVGRTAGPPVAEEGEEGASEASEWERLGGEE